MHTWKNIKEKPTFQLFLFLACAGKSDDIESKERTISQVERMPKISIIIPCFNAESRIRKCLDSVVNQTLRDIEILVVDDKSTDNTLTILREYENRDPRIHAFESPQNAGAAAARNIGINVATGEYIGFVDADDYLDTDFYEKLYNKSQESDADMIKGNHVTINLDGTVSKSRLNNNVKSDKYNFNHTFWTAIYKRSFLDKNKLRFMVGIITSQDAVFLAQCLYFANRIELVNDTFYNYHRCENSLDSYNLSPAKVKSRIDAFKALLDWANNIKDMPISDYISIFKIVYGLDVYTMQKQMSYPDQLKLCGAFVDIYNDAKYQNKLEPIFSTRVIELVKANNISGIHNEFFVRKYMVRLLGIIPLFKTTKVPTREAKNILFRIKISQNKIEIYLCGILVLKYK